MDWLGVHDGPGKLALMMPRMSHASKLLLLLLLIDKALEAGSVNPCQSTQL